MKNILLLILINIFSFVSYAQYEQKYSPCVSCPNGIENDNNTHVYNYESAREFDTSNITSDFGARRYSGYDWHGGIDFGRGPGARGDAIVAVDSGTIKYLNSYHGIKSIGIEGNHFNFGYRHLFHEDYMPAVNNQFKSGNFILKSRTLMMMLWGILGINIISQNLFQEFQRKIHLI